MKIKISLSCMAILLFLSGCDFGSSSSSSSSGLGVASSCTETESFIEDDTSIAISTSQEISQELSLILTSSGTTLSSVTVHMSSNGLSQVTMKIYPGGSQPEQGSPIATSTLTTGLGSSASTSPLTFAFNGISLSAGQSYYFVISAVGGPFNISESTTGTALWEKSSGSWTSISDGLSMSFQWNCL